jgi:hypothetical protein
MKRRADAESAERAGREEANMLGCTARARSALTKTRFLPHTASLVAKKTAVIPNRSEYVVSRETKLPRPATPRSQAQAAPEQKANETVGPKTGANHGPPPAGLLGDVSDVNKERVKERERECEEEKRVESSENDEVNVDKGRIGDFKKRGGERMVQGGRVEEN